MFGQPHDAVFLGEVERAEVLQGRVDAPPLILEVSWWHRLLAAVLPVSKHGIGSQALQAHGLERGATGCEARRAELEDDETDDLHVFFHLSIDVTKQIAGRSANILKQHLELKVEDGHQQLDALLDDDVPHPVVLDEDAAVEDVVRPPAFQGVLPHPLKPTAR